MYMNLYTRVFIIYKCLSFFLLTNECRVTFSVFINLVISIIKTYFFSNINYLANDYEMLSKPPKRFC